MEDPQLREINKKLENLLALPIKDEEELKKIKKWLEKWGHTCPKEWIDTVLDTMIEFKNRKE